MVLKDNKYRVRSMISITGSLSFAKLLMMSFATPKSGGGGGGGCQIRIPISIYSFVDQSIVP